MSSTETVTVVVVHTGRAGRDPYRRTTSEPLWSWRQQAVCGGMDSGVFFPSEGERGPARRRREQVAKAICAACPVREPCATYALVNRELQGVWGGLSEADRHRRLTHPWPRLTAAPAGVTANAFNSSLAPGTGQTREAAAPGPVRRHAKEPPCPPPVPSSTSTS